MARGGLFACVLVASAFHSGGQATGGDATGDEDAPPRTARRRSFTSSVSAAAHQLESAWDSARLALAAAVPRGSIDGMLQALWLSDDELLQRRAGQPGTGEVQLTTAPPWSGSEVNLVVVQPSGASASTAAFTGANSGTLAGRRGLVSSTAASASLPNASLLCNGVGILIPNPGPVLPPSTNPAMGYQCQPASGSFGSVNVTLALYTAMLDVQANGGSSARSAALSAAVLTEAPAFQFGSILQGGAPLQPAGWSSSLPPLQAALVAALLPAGGGGGANLSAVVNISQVFPAAGSGGTAQPVTTQAALLVSLPVDTVAGVAATSACSNFSITPSASGGTTEFQPGVCVCPLDYMGDNCEAPLHYSCSVAVADPLYHACVATNGAGWTPPTRAAPYRTVLPPDAGLGAAPSAGSTSDWWSYDLPLSSGENSSDSALPVDDAATAVSAWLAAAAQRWDSVRESGSLGPGSGVAVPASPATWSAAPGAVGIGGTDPTAPLPRPPDTVGYGRYHRRRSGDPPCMFLNRSHVALAAQAAAAATSAGIVPVHFRVTCGFTPQSPATAALSSGASLVNPLGMRYASLPWAALNTTAGRARAWLPPVLRPGVSAAWRCNGTVISTATAAALLQLRGINVTADGLFTAAGGGVLGGPADRFPFYASLGCAESRFAYTVGGPSASDAYTSNSSNAAARGRPPRLWALSAPPLFPLALRVRPVSPIYLSDVSGLVLVPIALQALGDGSTSGDVVVPLNVSALAADAGHWTAGRLLVEATVVQLAEGIGADGAGPLPSVPLAAALDAAAAPSAVQPPPPAYATVPLLLLSSIARVMIDDSSYVEPTSPNLLPLALGLGLGLGIPALLLGFGVYRWRRLRREMAEAAEVERHREAAELRRRGSVGASRGAQG